MDFSVPEPFSGWKRISPMYIELYPVSVNANKKSSSYEASSPLHTKRRNSTLPGSLLNPHSSAGRQQHNPTLFGFTKVQEERQKTVSSRMEQNKNRVISKKRKQPEEQPPNFSLDELNEDLLERILSWLPTSTFFRLRSVCKRWSSISRSSAFRMACSRIPSRDPWFYMVDSNLDRAIVYNTAEKRWSNLNYPNTLRTFEKPIPVASSGGLVCFRSLSGDFVVCNPVTGACRTIPTLVIQQTIHAIAMQSSTNSSSYKLIVVAGESPVLAMKVYDSNTNRWEDASLSRKTDESPESEFPGDECGYFLSTSGDVVVTNMQRSPSKQYSSVITPENGQTLYFLSGSGRVVACDIAGKSFSEYPRLLPMFYEYSLDVVECMGEMFVVVLWEFLESASLRVWRFSREDRLWCQIAAMPPAMSHEFYGKNADINCVGCGDLIMVCVNSGELSCEVLCDLKENKWVELPKYCVGGKMKEFMSAFCFEPRLETHV